VTCSIFIKSCAKDFEFLKYCLRSLVRFAGGFESIVVVTDNDGPKPPIGVLEKWFTVRPHEPRYNEQQVIKCNADAFTPSDLILYQDSDTIFTQPITPQDVTIGGLPVWLFEPYNGMTNVDVLARKAVVEKFVGAPVEHEFMRRHPFIVSREMLVELRRFCWRQHGCSIDEYLMTTEQVSEFNFMGAFLWNHYRSAVAWRRPEEMPTFVLQQWSHGPGLTDAIRAEFEEKLK